MAYYNITVKVSENIHIKESIKAKLFCNIVTGVILTQLYFARGNVAKTCKVVRGRGRMEVSCYTQMNQCF